MTIAVPTATRSIEDYAELAGRELIDEIVGLVEPLRGTRILHLSGAPSREYQVSTISTLVSMLRDAGLYPEWRVARVRPEQETVNEVLNEALNGRFVHWTHDMAETWTSQEYDHLGISPRDYDFIVVHGVEAAGIVAGTPSFRKASGPKWIWHCHTDVSKVQPDIWHFLTLHTMKYDIRIVSSVDQTSEGSRHPYTYIPLPIDPLSLKNGILPSSFVEIVLQKHRIDPRHPLVLTFIEKDENVGVTARIVEGFRLARKQVPMLQMLMMYVDDGNECQTLRNYKQLSGKADVRNLHLIPVPDRLGNISLNAFQRTALAVVEGSQSHDSTTFLLESMWKERPVIVGEKSAASLGIEDGRSGYVARSAEEIGQCLVRLADFDTTARRIGQAAREQIRANYLVTRLLHSYVTMLAELGGVGSIQTASRKTARAHARIR
jgi:trehalose synthase